MWKDLREQQYKDLFDTAETDGKARLVSCTIGWSCELEVSQQIDGYGLADHVDIFNPASGTALSASLRNAYESREPWLGYQWGTSDMALLLDVVRLEEPEYSEECWSTTKACAYPESTILIGANSALPDRAPEIADFLRQWDFSVDSHLKGATRWQAANPNASIEDAAFYWLIGNFDTWSGWVTVEAATRILASLNEDALAAAPASGRIAFQSERDGNSEVYVMNADGSDVTRLTNNSVDDLNPAWSPDGTRIAFASQRDGNSEVYVMNADGSGVTRLTDNSSYDDHPAWSPDGSGIAFHSNRDGNWEVYLMNADGSGITRLTDNPASDNNPAWSPDGSRIAFHSIRDGDYEIYVMNADGSGVTQLTSDSAWDFHPSWSPDGQRIAFYSERDGRILDGNYEIYVMNADGSSVTRLTNNSAHDTSPTWSSDGRHIAFTSSRDGNGEIYVMNADGSGVTRLTDNSASDGSPAWSATVMGTPTEPTAAMATRSFSPDPVAPGGTLTVTIDIADYGTFGTITETLPDGFSYLSSTHNSVAHPFNRNSQMVRFTLLGNTSVAYTVTASSVEGTHTFSGTLTDSGMNDIPVGGESTVTVGDAPLGVTLAYAGTTPAAPVRIGVPIPVSATFTKTVSGFALDDVTVVNGTASNFSGSADAYTFDVTPNGIGQVTVDVGGDVAQDSDENGNTAAMQLSLGIPYDDNRNDTIELDEALAAVNDYFSQGEALNLDHVFALINLYFGG